jgi:transposase-like protein
VGVDLTNPIFNDEDKAREWLEVSRWPNGPSCPHCGSAGVLRMGGKSHRPGLFQCRDCRGQFTVRTGQVMERSHIPLAKWVLGFHLMASSKKGVSAHQLHRTLGIAYNSAWFMAHRIREAMAEKNPAPLGGEGKIVEADETYYGDKEEVTKRTKRGKPSHGSKRPVVALVERGGAARAVYMPKVTAKNVGEVLAELRRQAQPPLHRRKQPVPESRRRVRGARDGATQRR